MAKQLVISGDLFSEKIIKDQALIILNSSVIKLFTFIMNLK